MPSVPTKPTRASPTLFTSNPAVLPSSVSVMMTMIFAEITSDYRPDASPSPLPPPPEPPDGSISSRRNFASFACTEQAIVRVQARVSHASSGDSMIRL